MEWDNSSYPLFVIISFFLAQHYLSFSLYGVVTASEDITGLLHVGRTLLQAHWSGHSSHPYGHFISNHDSRKKNLFIMHLIFLSNFSIKEGGNQREGWMDSDSWEDLLWSKKIPIRITVANLVNFIALSTQSPSPPSFPFFPLPASSSTSFRFPIFKLNIIK